MKRAKNPKIAEAETMKEIHKRVMGEEKKKHEKKSLEEVYEVYKKWMYFESMDVIDVILATALTREKRGTPVWIIIIGRSGSGKSQLIRALERIEDTKILDDLTAQTLASGAKIHIGKGKSRPVNDLGSEWEGKDTLVLTSDLATLTSKDATEKKAIWAKFRELFDGYVSRDTGNEVSKLYTDIHVTWIFGATPAIRSEVLIYAELGTRELMYEMPYDPRALDAKMDKAWDNENYEEDRKGEMQLVTTQFFNSHKYDKSIDVEHMKKFIYKESKRLEYLRGTAATDRQTSQLITDINRADSKRSMLQFKKLYKGLKSLDKEYTDEKAKRIIHNIVNSSGDPTRMRIMEMHEKEPERAFAIRDYVAELRVGNRTIKKQIYALWNMKFVTRDVVDETDKSGRHMDVEYFKKTEKALNEQILPPTPYSKKNEKNKKISSRGGSECALSEKMEKVRSAIDEGLNSYDELCEMFDVVFIERMKEKGVLIPIEGGKRYEIR